LRFADEKDAARKRQSERSRADSDSVARSARERAKDLEEARVNFLLSIVRGVAENEVRLTGHGGEAWTREIGALVAQISHSITLAPAGMSPEPTLDSLLKKWVEGRYLEPHPQGHSFCKCGSSPYELAAAACLSVKKIRESGEVSSTAPIGPDYACAGDETCSGCPHNVQRAAANERYWRAKLTEAENAAQNGATASARASATRRAARLREHCTRCFED
jgi:hypothetical protein